MRRRILENRLAAARERNPASSSPTRCSTTWRRSVATNGRDLDGALNRLVCRAEFSDAPITMEIAEMAIADLVGMREPRRIRIEDIQKVVASHFNVSKHDLLSARRTRAIVRPRQIAMYLAKTMTPRSFPGDRQALRRPRPHDGAARRAQGRGTCGCRRGLAQEIELLKRLIQE